ncbi:hypothetical protein U1Q18_037028 [Sarracenia purpurea var. burkii]
MFLSITQSQESHPLISASLHFTSSSHRRRTNVRKGLQGYSHLVGLDIYKEHPLNYMHCLKNILWFETAERPSMSLACLVCQGVESPSHSFRSYSVSSSDNEGRCSAIANCLARKISLAHLGANTSIASSSKVTPHPSIPNNGVVGPPRLVRSHAVTRDLVRDWNFDEVAVGR